MKPSDVRILIVDDEPTLLETIAFLFKTFQFQVDTANCGNDAWQMLQEKDYNLVLTDIRMPNGDGIELTKKIKARQASHPCVLFMSGFSDLLNEEIYHTGGEGKFTKPFDTKAVRSAIQTCLLEPHAKWKQPLPSGNRILTIEKTGVDAAFLEEQKVVIFGRGGFFISHAFTPPEKGSSILFSIQIEQPNPVTFKGAGVVRWIQNHGKNGIPPGLGIEITTMNEAEAKIYNQMFGQVIPFIPSAGRMSSNVAS